MYGIGVVDCKLIGQLGAVHRDHFTNMETFTGSVYEGLDNIYSQESKLLTDLQDFNQKYLDYTSCSSSSCSTLSAKTKAMNDAYDLIINTDIPNLNKNMPSTGLSPAQYDASYSHLVSTHNNVLLLRNELDVKTKELNMEPNTKYGDYKANFDSAIYTNILVTVLATTILYFAFVKL
jgi:hypothetical protein